jgi:hypothetical protein
MIYQRRKGVRSNGSGCWVVFVELDLVGYLTRVLGQNSLLHVFQMTLRERSIPRR